MQNLYAKRMSSTFSSQTSKEDQVNLNSYANTFISSNFFFSTFKYLWHPYVQSVSTASTGFYFILVLRSSPFKVGGYFHNHKEYPSSIGVAEIPTWGNWPHQIFMGNFAPSGSLWPFDHITLPWPIMAPTIIYGLRPYPAIIGLPGQFPYPQHPGLCLCFGPGGLSVF
ncbi:hypothetical protein O181_081027 [Austropuccinia psidii MF-1]|uniref:Uncharacterized protein n=1 Tax=Austropuccinia psidii MF-1 TaxID=1389203 RepID=A0A9Q3FMR8_9BASI|nr:hypothetical protein [Austropuccinia psidii MF-1]